MRQTRTLGSARGAASNGGPYRDKPLEAEHRAPPSLARRRTPVQRLGWNMHDGDHATLHDARTYVESLTPEQLEVRRRREARG